MEKDIPHKQKSNKTGVPLLISDKVGFKIKTVIRDKEGHYTMIKGSMQGKGIAILNIYVPKLRAPQYIRQPYKRILTLIITMV